jgi:hypothetical protein
MPAKPLTVGDIALGVFLGMMAFSIVGGIVWWLLVYATVNS